MINYLKENNLGKASFVSLEMLRRVNKGREGAENRGAGTGDKGAGIRDSSRAGIGDSSRTGIGDSSRTEIGDNGQGAGLTPIRNFVKGRFKYEPAIEYFFGNAFLAESIEECAKNFDGSNTMTVVTKSGAMFDNGRISGGSVSENGDTLLIGRKSRLEDIRSELAEAGEKCDFARKEPQRKRGHSQGP